MNSEFTDSLPDPPRRHPVQFADLVIVEPLVHVQVGERLLGQAQGRQRATFRPDRDPMPSQRGAYPGVGCLQSGSRLVDPHFTLHVQLMELLGGDRWRWDAVDPSRFAKGDPVSLQRRGDPGRGDAHRSGDLRHRHLLLDIQAA